MPPSGSNQNLQLSVKNKNSQKNAFSKLFSKKNKISKDFKKAKLKGIKKR